ncbi:MAG: flagella basal body P-ring formation protein FlgA [Caulobacterales bacterium]|jgi:flagella basal body P-ring formation protein FlgA
MKAALFALAAGFALLALSADAAELRANPQASGPSVTFGDLFTDAGAAAAKPIAPAPAPGAEGVYSARFIAAAAQAEGIQWSPPPGMDAIRVSRRIDNARAASAAAYRQGGVSRADAVIRTNDAVTVNYIAGGVRLTLRGRALSPAAKGESVRVLNLQSNRTIDAIAEGPGAASIAATGS